MNPFEVTYLGPSRFHRDQDATTMYFRVLRGGRYMGAYAGAISGSDMVSLDHTMSKQAMSKQFWAALAHVTTRSIGARLLGGIRTESELHAAETIWIKAHELKAHMDDLLPLPIEDQVFETFAFDDDPLAQPVEGREPRIASVPAARLGLKAVTATPIE